MIGAVALIAALLPHSLQAQTSTTPSAPTSVAAMKGDVEASITWASGGSGVGGNCASTKYFVRLYDVTTEDLVAESTFIPQPQSGNPSWFVDELTASTAYEIEIYAYGASRGDWSEPVYKEFTTNAATAGGDPSAPSPRKKRAPRRVSGMTVVLNDPSVTISWTASPAGNNPKRCTSASPRKYGYFLENATTEETVNLPSDETGSTSITLNKNTDNIPAGTYYLRVTSYSSECDDWSRYVESETWTFS